MSFYSVQGDFYPKSLPFSKPHQVVFVPKTNQLTKQCVKAKENGYEQQNPQKKVKLATILTTLEEFLRITRVFNGLGRTC